MIRGVNVLIFFKRSFRYENEDKNRKRNDRFFKKFVLKKWSFLTIVIKNDRFYKNPLFVNDR